MRRRILSQLGKKRTDEVFVVGRCHVARTLMMRFPFLPTSFPSAPPNTKGVGREELTKQRQQA